MIPPEQRRRRRAARQLARRAASGDSQAALQAVPSDQFALFHDIEVVPGDSFRLGSVLVNGGPVWPDFDQQSLVRLMRRGAYVDKPVPASGEVCDVITRPCVWGGYAIAHFGHLVADHLTRVLEARINRPDDRVLFLLRPGGQVTDLPEYFWQLLDWYGVRRDQVHFVTKPVQVVELRCFAQAEPFESYAPSPRYLQLLSENAARMGVQPEPATVLYVGRIGMSALGKGGSAGEGYLIEVLLRAGVKVLDPARASLSEQIACYAGAATLIFAEGSAVHGRQLLGWLDQTIVVLNRRKRARIAEAALQARCRALLYVEASAQSIRMGTIGTGKQAALGLALYDLDAVFAAFAQYGIDLGPLWDADGFAASVKREAEAWLSAQAQSRGAVMFDLHRAVKQLHEAGVPVDFAVSG